MDAEHLVDVIRGNLVESEHWGHIAVVNGDGEVLYSNGDPNRVTFARSSMKPLQAIPIVETGAATAYELDQADLSLACASHSGEDQHTDRVKSILGRLGLTPSSLKCGTHPPRWKETYDALIKSGTEVTAEYNNCSGKHSGMLATAIHMGESVEDYYKTDHPVQQRIMEVISDLAEVPVDEIEIGIDGCGVPVHGIPLKNLAMSFAKMANPSSQPEERRKAIEQVTSSMMAAPEMVAGTERFCSDFMRVEEGRMFGKGGAEGVYCIGDLVTGLGIAIKIEDGAGRATSPVAVEVLEQLGLLTEKQKGLLRDYHYPKLKNCRDEVIGQLRPAFTLKKSVHSFS
ncbi:asparaginase [Sporosarcina sp. Marseille-Q4063]|uniref:asparaginase n=1 Tax=Sporosarcina sp. Marseille-Q4063 TaxID=2810514 RepID=UPI001BB006ED|nr:asparaginase [Sporosarcina sp. Marseille-Q4063]QUW21325.1 asparaginase [Sporosarcina sp. Marseille-Q4063]